MFETEFIRNTHFTVVSHNAEFRDWCYRPCYGSLSTHVGACSEQDDEVYLVETITIESWWLYFIKSFRDLFDLTQARFGSERVIELAKEAR